MILPERPAASPTELDVVLRQVLRASVGNQRPSPQVRLALIERAREQQPDLQPRRPWALVLAWLDEVLLFSPVWSTRPNKTCLYLDNFYLIGVYQINWRWFM